MQKREPTIFFSVRFPPQIQMLINEVESKNAVSSPKITPIDKKEEIRLLFFPVSLLSLSLD